MTYDRQIMIEIMKGDLTRGKSNVKITNLYVPEISPRSDQACVVSTGPVSTD